MAGMAISSLKLNVMSAAIAIAFVSPLTWMLMDRDPPYIRLGGRIEVADPEHCGIPSNAVSSTTRITPGSCIEVEWKIQAKRNCPGNAPFNVSRAIIDTQGEHQLARATSVYTLEAYPEEIVRYFTIPYTLSPGPARYHSVACYACNPLQHVVNPICISSPDIFFTVEAKEQK